jgi:hypothetical protein
MKRLLVLTALLAAVAFPALALGDLILGDADKITDHGTTAQVVSVSGGQAVLLDFKYSGLGSHTVTITVSAPFFCTNNGGNNPPGQISATSQPITPENGNVTGTLTTNAASCPDHMAPTIGPTVTVTLTLDDGSSKVFTYTV